MKYILGILIGLILGSAGVALGLSYYSNIEATDYLNLSTQNGNNYPYGFVNYSGNIIKTYDTADNVVCYEAIGVGISCLQDN